MATVKGLDCRVMLDPGPDGPRPEKPQFVVAREEADRRNGRFRAPHHTVNYLGLVHELCMSAGGVLFLDQILEFRRPDVRHLLRAAASMAEDARPTVFLSAPYERFPEVQDLLDELEAAPLLHG